MSLLSFLASYVVLNFSIQLSISVVTLYDHVITIDQEVELIWKQRWTYAKVLYIFIRYIGDFLVILNIIGSTANTVPLPEFGEFCANFFQVQFVLGLAVIFAAQIILQLRLYAMYLKSRKIAAFTSTFFVAEIVASMTIGVRIYFSGVVGVPATRAGPTNSPGCTIFGVIGSNGFTVWIPVMLFESILCCLAVWIVIEHKIRSQQNLPLLQILVRDNIFYFIAITIVYVIELVLWFVSLHDTTVGVLGLSGDSIAFAATTIMGSRLILNLRGRSFRDEMTIPSFVIRSMMARSPL